MRQAPSDAPAYYLLDQVESDTVHGFVDLWTEQDFRLFDLVMGQPLSVAYLFKLEKKYNPNTWGERAEIQNILNYIKSEQRVNGRIKTNELSHTGPLWALLQYEPDSVATQNAIEYFKHKVNSEEWCNQFQGIARLAIGALILCEDDFDRHKQSLYSIGEQLEANLDDFAESRLNEGNKVPRYKQAACVLLALTKLPGNHSQSIQQLVEDLQDSQDSEGYWFGEPLICESAMAALGLISAGKGPKIPAHAVEWQRTLNEQARHRSKPQFASTVPAKADTTSNREIYDRSKSLITSAHQELRIGSLYIDMLYDEILDLSRDNSNLEMKILTRGRSVSGNRQRIKKTVLDELIESTDGNVRENHRFHSRMVISDEDAMIISSADLTRDQLRDEFNAGIYTSDPTAIQRTIEFFDRVWDESDRVEHS